MILKIPETRRRVKIISLFPFHSRLTTSSFLFLCHCLFISHLPVSSPLIFSTSPWGSLKTLISDDPWFLLRSFFCWVKSVFTCPFWGLELHGGCIPVGCLGFSLKPLSSRDTQAGTIEHASTELLNWQIILSPFATSPPIHFCIPYFFQNSFLPLFNFTS